MAKAKRDDLVWTDVDASTFKGPLAKAYTAMREARKAAQDARDNFETMFRKVGEGKAFAEGMSCVFSHNFGKLSIAEVEPHEVTSTQKKEKRAPIKF